MAEAGSLGEAAIDHAYYTKYSRSDKVIYRRCPRSFRERMCYVRSSTSTEAYNTAAGSGRECTADPSDRGCRCDGPVPVHMVAGDDRSTLNPLLSAALCAPRAQEVPTRTVRLPPLWSLVLRTRSGRPMSCSDGKASFVMMAGGGGATVAASSCGPDSVVVGAVDGPQRAVVVVVVVEVVKTTMSTDRRGWMGGDARRWTLLKAPAALMLLLLLLPARLDLAGAVRWHG
jgi:hypothetical protein